MGKVVGKRKEKENRRKGKRVTKVGDKSTSRQDRWCYVGFVSKVWSNTLNRGRIEECPIERKKIQEEKRDEEEKEEREKKKRTGA